VNLFKHLPAKFTLCECFRAVDLKNHSNHSDHSDKSKPTFLSTNNKLKNMKKLLLTAVLTLIGIHTATAQVGIGTEAPKTSLQVVGKPASTSTADGVQVPSLSLAQLDAKITAYGTEQDGAIVYIDDVTVASTKTETAKITATGYYYYDATNDVWNAMKTTTYSVGDFAQGGIVFWVDETGQHGLVASKEDQSTGVKWYAGDFGFTHSKGDGPFAGEANTSIIIAAQVAIGDDGNTYAARICNELQITEGGKTYGDWYLSSKEELNLMYQNIGPGNLLKLGNIGNFASAYYWSSTENDKYNARAQSFGGGGQFNSGKNSTKRVRAVRAF
jgi:hypothetical protein